MDRIHPLLYDQFDKKKFSDIELILSAGDLSPDFLCFLVTRLNKRCYYVRGNHDVIYQKQLALGCDDIDKKVVNHENIRILGLEGSMWTGGRGVEYTERQMGWKIFKLSSQIRKSGGVDVVLAHTPPKGIHDAKDLYHTGFGPFLKLIKKFKPQYFIHGHTHVDQKYKHRGRITDLHGTNVVQVDGYCILEVEPRM